MISSSFRNRSIELRRLNKKNRLTDNKEIIHCFCSRRFLFVDEGRHLEEIIGLQRNCADRTLNSMVPTGSAMEPETAIEPWTRLPVPRRVRHSFKHQLALWIEWGTAIRLTCSEIAVVSTGFRRRLGSKRHSHGFPEDAIVLLTDRTLSFLRFLCLFCCCCCCCDYGGTVSRRISATNWSTFASAASAFRKCSRARSASCGVDRAWKCSSSRSTPPPPPQSIPPRRIRFLSIWRYRFDFLSWFFTELKALKENLMNTNE